MKKGMIILLVVLGVVGLGFMYFIGSRNTLVNLEEEVNEKWAQLQNVYQRRMDLVPNLVEAAKGAAAAERKTLTEVMEARAKATQVTQQITPEAMKQITENPEQFQKFQQAQDSLSQSLGRLMVVVERYPEVKGSQGFLNLQTQLEGTENRITVERMRYNESARKYNTAIRVFPSNIVASLFGFQRKQFFEAQQGADVAPKINVYQ